MRCLGFLSPQRLSLESALHAAVPAVTVDETCRAAGAACALGPMLHESKMASAASVVVSDEDMVACVDDNSSGVDLVIRSALPEVFLLVLKHPSSGARWSG